MNDSESPWSTLSTPSPEQVLSMRGVKGMPGFKWVKDSSDRNGLGLELLSSGGVDLSAAFEHIRFALVEYPSDTSAGVFCIFCESSEYQELFEGLCTHMLPDLKNITEPNAQAKAIILRAKAWAAFFKSGGKRLSRQKELGLMCELLFLREFWLPAGRPLSDWVGPSGAAQDYQTENSELAVEIKHVDLEYKVKISSIHQLESEEKLFLCAYRLSESEEGISLDEEVQVIANSLKGSDREIFYRLLILAGYHPDHGYLDRYTKSEFLSWEVSDEFPKITPSTQLAIQSCRYEILLKPHADKFVMSTEELEVAIGSC